MKNEIDKTVETIGQLPDDAECLYVAKDDGTGTRPFLTVKDIKALCTAYTQLKADLATAKQEGASNQDCLCNVCIGKE